MLKQAIAVIHVVNLDLRGLRAFPAKDSTPLYVPTAGMARRALAGPDLTVVNLPTGERWEPAP